MYLWKRNLLNGNTIGTSFYSFRYSQLWPGSRAGATQLWTSPCADNWCFDPLFALWNRPQALLYNYSNGGGCLCAEASTSFWTWSQKNDHSLRFALVEAARLIQLSQTNFKTTTCETLTLCILVCFVRCTRSHIFLHYQWTQNDHALDYSPKGLRN